MTKKKVLFIFVGEGSFVLKDIELISTAYDVTSYNFKPTNKWKTPFQLFNQFFFLVFRTRGINIFLLQLAGYHSVLPVLISKITGKKSLIISGGTDCHSFPSIRYGNYQKKLLAFFTRLSFKYCTHIAPKHSTLWYCDYSYSKNNFAHQGIKFFNKNINKPYTIIENGYDPIIFKNKNLKRDQSFVTVAGGVNFPFLLQLKGIDLIVDAARHFPQHSFTIVSVLDVNQFKNIPENVKLLPPVANNLLPEIFSSHKYYFQLSMAEGFPNALCEAMLCECVPIGSNVFSIPEIIGDSGYILYENNSNMLVDLIHQALKSNTDVLGKIARNRIIDNYSIKNRQNKLIKLLQSLN